jgi:hypothetical protein
VEATTIKPFQSDEDNHSGIGLLLRADGNSPKRKDSSPLLGNGEERPASRLTVLGRTVGAGNHFLNDFLAFSTRIIPKFLFGLLLRRRLTDDDIGLGTIRVLLAAPCQNKMLTGRVGRDDTLTQLTTEHGNEPMD